VRQPQVVRPALLVLAVVLAVPVVQAGWFMVRTAAFLGEFLSDDRYRPLSALTLPPARRRLSAPAARADRYTPRTFSGGRPLVLVHGFTPEGRHDPRVRRAATLLARAGFDVAVPTIPGLTAARLRPSDAEPVVATLLARPEPAVLLSVSIGAGPAFLAAADARARDRVTTLVSLGGYASAAELTRFFLTGDYAWDGTRGHVDHDPALVRTFLSANLELLGPDARRLLDRDPGAIAAFLAAPPPAARDLLDALSPLTRLPDIHAPLVLIHGRNDRAVPYTETLRLAAARPRGTRVALLGLVEHVEGTRTRWWAARDILDLWVILYRLVAQG
jgi:pimeloyl-ACP methyl ester carboxylesterase